MPRNRKYRATKSPTGTYVYDKELGKLVKVSDRARLSKGGARDGDLGPCGRPRSACGGGCS